MHSSVVLVLCLRVIDCDVIDWLDLPELTSIQLGASAFMFNWDDASTTLIMRGAEMNVKWLSRLAQTHFNHNSKHYRLGWRSSRELHIPLCSIHHSWEWFSSIPKSALDMPSISYVYLPRAFERKKWATVRSTHFIPPSPIDIGVLAYHPNL